MASQIILTSFKNKSRQFLEQLHFDQLTENLPRIDTATLIGNVKSKVAGIVSGNCVPVDSFHKSLDLYQFVVTNSDSKKV
jgi:hypothetical protein